MGPASSASRLRIIAATRWKNARCGAISRVSSRGTASANAVDSRFTIPRNRFQPVSSPTVCFTSSTWSIAPQIHPQHVRRLRVQRRRVIEAVEKTPQLLERRPHRRDRFVLKLLDRLVRLARRVGVRRQRIGQRVGQSDQVDDQPAGLLAVDAVHAGDRLHQVVPGQRLVEVHRVRARHVEARQPHVHDDRQPEVVGRVLESVRQRLPLRLAPHVPGDVLGIVRARRS